MSKREIYKCDICQADSKSMSMIGVVRSCGLPLRLAHYSASDFHICIACASALKDQLSKTELDPRGEAL